MKKMLKFIAISTMVVVSFKIVLVHASTQEASIRAGEEVQIVASAKEKKSNEEHANSLGITLEVKTPETALDTDTIYFPDINLYEGLISSSSSYINSYDGIQVSEAKSITNLTGLYSKNIADLTGLDYFVNVETLDLHYNQIVDVSPLYDMKKLSILKLNGNFIQKVDKLSELTNLTVLYLDSNMIEDVTPLSTLVNLDTLKVANNRIEDISPIDDLVNLTYLSLGMNQLDDISSLSTLVNLTSSSFALDQIAYSKPVTHKLGDTSIVQSQSIDRFGVTATLEYTPSGTGNNNSKDTLKNDVDGDKSVYCGPDCEYVYAEWILDFHKPGDHKFTGTSMQRINYIPEIDNVLESDSNNDSVIDTTDDDSQAMVGETLSYNLTVNNDNTSSMEPFSMKFTSSSEINPINSKDIKIYNLTEDKEITTGFTFDQSSQILTIDSIPEKTVYKVNYKIKVKDEFNNTDPILFKVAPIANELELPIIEEEIPKDVVNSSSVNFTSRIMSINSNSSISDANVGDTITYGLEVSNTGNAPLENSVITMNLDADMEKNIKNIHVYQNSTEIADGFSVEENTIKFNKNIDLKEKYEVEFDVSVNDVFSTNTELVMNSTYSSNYTSNIEKNIYTSKNIKDATKYSVDHKVDNTNIKTGELLHYNDTITNVGYTNISKLLIKEHFDDETNQEIENVKVHLDGSDVSEDCTITKKDIVYNNDLPIGSSLTVVYDVQVKNQFSDTNSLNNQIIIQTEFTDPIVYDGYITKDIINSSSADFTSKMVDINSNPSISEAKVGDIISYQLEVSNTGDAPLENSSIAINLDQDMEKIKNIHVYQNGTEIKTGFHILENTIIFDRSIETGEKYEVKFDVEISAIFSTNDQLVMNSIYSSEYTSNIEENIFTDKNIKDAIKFSVDHKLSSINGDETNTNVQANDTLYYSDEITNIGYSKISNIQINAELDEETSQEFINTKVYLNGADVTKDCTITKNYIMYNKDLEIGSNLIATYEVKVDNQFLDSDPLNNQVTIKTGYTDSVKYDNYITKDLKGITNLQIANELKAVNGDETINTAKVDDILSYHLKLKNIGSVPIEQLFIENISTTEMNNKFDNVSIKYDGKNLSDDWEVNDNIITINKPLNIGSEVDVNFDIKVNSEFVNDDSLVNTLNIKSNLLEINTVKTATLKDIVGSSSYTVDVINDEEKVVKNNDKIHQNIKLINTGGYTLNNIIISFVNDSDCDDLIENVHVFIDGKENFNNYVIKGNQIKFNTPIQIGQVLNIEYDVQVSPTFSNVDEIINHFYIDSDYTDSKEYQQTIKKDITSASNLGIEQKIVSINDSELTGYVYPNDELVYTTTISNNGSIPLYDLKVEEEKDSRVDQMDLTIVDKVEGDEIPFEILNNQVTFINPMPINSVYEITYKSKIVSNFDLEEPIKNELNFTSYDTTYPESIIYQNYLKEKIIPTIESSEVSIGESKAPTNKEELLKLMKVSAIDSDGNILNVEINNEDNYNFKDPQKGNYKFTFSTSVNGINATSSSILHIVDDKAIEILPVESIVNPKSVVQIGDNIIVTGTSNIFIIIIVLLLIIILFVKRKIKL